MKILISHSTIVLSLLIAYYYVAHCLSCINNNFYILPMFYVCCSLFIMCCSVANVLYYLWYSLLSMHTLPMLSILLTLCMYVYFSLFFPIICILQGVTNSKTCVQILISGFSVTMDFTKISWDFSDKIWLLYRPVGSRPALELDFCFTYFHCDTSFILLARSFFTY